MLLAPAAQLVEQPADLGEVNFVVRDAAERRELLGADRGAARRHHHVLVPAEERRGLAEIGDLGEAPAQLVELGLAHGSETYMSAMTAVRGESSEDDLSPGLTAPVRATANGVCIRRRASADRQL